MRALLVVVLAALVAALETEHFVVVGGDEGYRARVAGFLEEAYSFYLSKGLSPAPPCDGSKYLVNITSQGGETSFAVSGGRVCISRLEFGRYSDTVLRPLVYHEVGHVFQLNYVSGGVGYEWFIEALPEAMASLGSGDYYWVSQYFPRQLYKQNPFTAAHDDWYLYGAAFV